MENSKMVYTSATTAPVIDTMYYDGVKFDICEVVSSCYNLLDNKKSRFFVVVEDSFIYGEKLASEFSEVSGQTRWGMFCKTKTECINYINGYDKLLAEYNKYIVKSSKKGFKLYANRASEVSTKIKTMYGFNQK